MSRGYALPEEFADLEGESVVDVERKFPDIDAIYFLLLLIKKRKESVVTKSADNFSEVLNSIFLKIRSIDKGEYVAPEVLPEVQESQSYKEKEKLLRKELDLIIDEAIKQNGLVVDDDYKRKISRFKNYVIGKWSDENSKPEERINFIRKLCELVLVANQIDWKSFFNAFPPTDLLCLGGITVDVEELIPNQSLLDQAGEDALYKLINDLKKAVSEDMEVHFRPYLQYVLGFMTREELERLDVYSLITETFITPQNLDKALDKYPKILKEKLLRLIDIQSSEENILAQIKILALEVIDELPEEFNGQENKERILGWFSKDGFEIREDEFPLKKEVEKLLLPKIKREFEGELIEGLVSDIFTIGNSQNKYILNINDAFLEFLTSIQKNKIEELLTEANEISSQEFLVDLSYDPIELNSLDVAYEDNIKRIIQHLESKDKRYILKALNALFAIAKKGVGGTMFHYLCDETLREAIINFTKNTQEVNEGTKDALFYEANLFKLDEFITRREETYDYFSKKLPQLLPILEAKSREEIREALEKIRSEGKLRYIPLFYLVSHLSFNRAKDLMELVTKDEIAIAIAKDLQINFEATGNKNLIENLAIRADIALIFELSVQKYGDSISPELKESFAIFAIAIMAMQKKHGIDCDLQAITNFLNNLTSLSNIFHKYLLEYIENSNDIVDSNLIAKLVLLFEDSNQTSLFLEVVRYGHLGVVDELLSKKRELVDSVDDEGITALMIAVEEGNEIMFDKLLNAGADANIQNDHRCTALIYAIDQGRNKMIDILLEEGRNTDVNAQDIDKWSALMYAVEKKNEGAIDKLLERGIDINSKDGKSRTALMYAARKGYPGVVDKLLDGGASVDIRDYKESTALILAAREGHLEIVRKLLNKGAGFDIEDSNECTALIHASYKGYTDIITELLNRGANVDFSDKNKCTALIFAAQQGHIETVRKLLDRGANVNAKTTNFVTALMLAVQNGHEQVSSQLLERGADFNARDSNRKTILMHAARDGNIVNVENILNRGAKVNSKDINGWTALMYAAQKGHEQVIDILLKEKNRFKRFFGKFFKKNINAKNANGWTALMYATEEGYDKAVTSLLKQGAKVNSRNIYGQTALIIAAQRGHTVLVNKFLQKKGRLRRFFSKFLKKDINIKDNSGKTALMYAAEKGDTETVKALFDGRANIEDSSQNGNTALMYAVSSKNEETVREFLNRGVNINAKNKDGYTALIMAVSIGSREIVAALLDEEADVNIQTKDGHTPLMLAVTKGYDEIVDIFLQKEVDLTIKNNRQDTPLSIAIGCKHFDIAVKILASQNINAEITKIDGEQKLCIEECSQNIVDLFGGDLDEISQDVIFSNSVVSTSLNNNNRSFTTNTSPSSTIAPNEVIPVIVEQQQQNLLNH